MVGVAAGNEAFYWTANTGMIGLGFLSGATNSHAAAISGYGTTIVGTSGNEAFMWNQASGLVGLGDLPGGNFFSAAKAVSADGKIIVGWGSTPNGTEAF